MSGPDTTDASIRAPTPNPESNDLLTSMPSVVTALSAAAAANAAAAADKSEVTATALDESLAAVVWSLGRLI